MIFDFVVFPSFFLLLLRRKDGAAALGGIKASDQIVTADGKMLETMTHDSVVELLSSLAGRSAVTFMITRAQDLVINIDDEV